MRTASRAPRPRRCCAGPSRCRWCLERGCPNAYVLTMAEAGFLEKTVRFLRPVLPRRFRGDLPVVPVVRLSGVIGFSTPLRPGLTLASVAKPLERAFAWPRARAVALLINSPG